MSSTPTITDSRRRLHLVPRIAEPTSVIIYRPVESDNAAEDNAAMLANLEARGVAYAAPVDVQRQLWARGGSYARLSHRIACRRAVTA